MALRSALVDRARTVTRGGTGRRVAGKTVMAPQVGPWFACRLNVAENAPEDRAERQLARSRTMRGPTLTYWTTASDGSSVELGPQDELEVEANNVGDGGATRWLVNGRPLVIRRKRRLFGAALAQVSQVGESGAESGGAI